MSRLRLSSCLNSLEQNWEECVGPTPRRGRLTLSRQPGILVLTLNRKLLRLQIPLFPGFFFQLLHFFSPCLKKATLWSLGSLTLPISPVCRWENRGLKKVPQLSKNDPFPGLHEASWVDTAPTLGIVNVTQKVYKKLSSKLTHSFETQRWT